MFQQETLEGYKTYFHEVIGWVHLTTSFVPHSCENWTVKTSANADYSCICTSGLQFGQLYWNQVSLHILVYYKGELEHLQYWHLY